MHPLEAASLKQIQQQNELCLRIPESDIQVNKGNAQSIWWLSRIIHTGHFALFLSPQR